MNAEKTGSLIRSLRIKKGLTQKELAQMICVTDKAVCKWEKGRGCPNITLISQLSKVLEVDIQSILQGYLENSNVNVVSEITELVSAQRAYEMNSKVITTADQMLSTINQLKS